MSKFFYDQIDVSFKILELKRISTHLVKGKFGIDKSAGNNIIN